MRAQPYVALDVGYMEEDEFRALFGLAETCSRQLSAFMAYLKWHPDRREIRETGVEYQVDVEPSKLQTFKRSNESL